MSENKTIETPEKEKLPVSSPQPPKSKPKQEKKKANIKTIITVVVVAQVCLAILVGAFIFKSSYENAKTNTVKQIRETAYNTVYDLTEGANHTSNRAMIALDGIRKEAALEVLEINTSYLYADAENAAKNLTIWYKIPGTGTFTVDLQMAEFIIDSERQHVLVKAPLPSITQFREGHPEELEYRDDRFVFKGSIKEGEEIARKMLYQGHVEMMKSLEENKEYLEAAKASAQKLITNIIRSLNPSLKNLSVTVEFADII